MKNERVVILGGGLAGIMAARTLGRDYLLVEREAKLGGLATTDRIGPFHFDKTGHWLHLRREPMQQLVRSLMGDSELLGIERKSSIFTHGRFVPYPFQANTYGLPPELNRECLLGFIEAFVARQCGEAGPEPESFDRWIRFHYGNGIARHFMIPYNTKLWGVPPDAITSLWCQRFVPKPSLEEVVAGAVGCTKHELGYNVTFLYPRRGGIESLTAKLAAGLDNVQLSTQPLQIDLKRKEVAFADFSVRYQSIISSIPLPSLIDLVAEIPAEVEQARQLLRWTPLHYLSIAVRGAALSGYHWIYVPEERFPFYRVGCYSNAVAAMAPEGTSTLYVEISNTCDGADPDLLPRIHEALAEVGAIGSEADILQEQRCYLPFAYVIFDKHYAAARQYLLSFLQENAIHSVGRFGAWVYCSMEDAMWMGREAALKLCP